MIEGGCLCGGVRYRVRKLADQASHCHCSMCRKAHGAPVGTYVAVPEGAFEWLQGEELVTGYRSSEAVLRTFCSVCGSTLQFIEDGETPVIDVSMGTLDGDPGVRPAYHIYTASKAPWYPITDGLPQYEEGI